jgi:hypothetical protein
VEGVGGVQLTPREPQWSNHSPVSELRGFLSDPGTVLVSQGPARGLGWEELSEARTGTKPCRRVPTSM